MPTNENEPLPEAFRREFSGPPVIEGKDWDLPEMEETPPFELEEPTHTGYRIDDSAELIPAVFGALGAARTHERSGTGDPQQIGNELLRYIEGVYGDGRSREAVFAHQNMEKAESSPQPGMIRVDDFHIREVALSLAVQAGGEIVSNAKAFEKFLQGEDQ